MMLSQRAAAFSVQALLTEPEDTTGSQSMSYSKANSSEDMAAEDMSERLRNSQSLLEEQTTPTLLHHVKDSVRKANTPFGGTSGVRSDRDVSSPAGGDEDEDLLVDVEDCSSPNPQQSCVYPDPDRCRTPLHTASSNPVCLLPSQDFTRESFSTTPPSGAAEWQYRVLQMLRQMPNLRWSAGEEEVESHGEGVKIQLLQRELWSKFHNLITEMIITKNGRRMFPVIKVRLRDLDPEKTYAVFLDMAAVDTRRYRYVYPSSRWMVAGTGEPLGDHTPYIHPDSPATGVQWMATPAIAFDRLKLTNNKTRDAQGQIVLHSMQKYVPRVWVQEVPAGTSWADLPRLLDTSTAVCSSFPETTFITVTAYQNQQITRLKIESNPFAKGFRDTSKQKELERRGVTITSRGCDGGATTPPSPIPLPLNVPSPRQFHFPSPLTALPRPFTFPGPLSPPVSPLLLPPTHWLSNLKTGDPPWLPTPTSPLLQSTQPSSLPFLLPSFLPALQSQLPRALDLSKPKDT